MRAFSDCKMLNLLPFPMHQFAITSHLEFSQDYQGFAWTEFAIEGNGQEDADQIVAEFLNSTAYSYDSLYDCIKAKPNSGYLERAFDFDVAGLADFKKTDNAGVCKFLLEFKEEGFWGEDVKQYTKLLESYFEIHDKNSKAEFYIISKDWFPSGDPKVSEPQAWCYTYYFLIISVDLVSRTLVLSEWNYD